ncbi:MAG: VWA domain-containing protein [Treponema sp.]|nr:VWA domain-containing protein [Treponema sp.]MBR6912512.1 VWA domain-containing protein [Treponema sp.]
MANNSLTDTDKQQISRWRLILGEEAEDALKDTAPEGEYGGLSEKQILMDQTLSAIYGSRDETFSNSRSAGNKKSSPVLSKWLGNLRSLFDNETVVVVQNDAIERKGLKQLLLEPELLESIEPDMNMASLLLELKDQIPSKSKESARHYIKKIVEKINSLLESRIRSSVTASLNKKSHSPLPSASAIDFKYTISRNLKNFNKEVGSIIPERVWFYDRRAKSSKWNIILDIDQSGSMGESIIFSSIMASILASMSSVKTNIVAFDTEIMDLTDLSSDPVDLLFGFQMGGGTDIKKSIEYCQSLVTDPTHTLFFLISDLDEYGSRNGLLTKIQELKDSGVTVIVLLAIADGGKAYYDKTTASEIAKMSVPCFACPPERLPELLAGALMKHDLTGFMKK